MTDASQLSGDFLSTFAATAGPGLTLPFDRFMDLALYDPAVGYYRKNRKRIGFDQGTDFFTSSSSDPVFGELIAAACTALLGPRPASEYTFVEIGAEPGTGVLAHVPHPFRAIRTCGPGDDLVFSGKCVIFSNELFDAQPFRRFVRRGEGWRELGVQLRNGALHEMELATTPPPELPAGLPDGYIIDAPFTAAALVERITMQSWTGLFVACDYGKTWRELTEACPAGTARAYFRHAQSNDLLARPGEQDLTCHPCWDWLTTGLERHGFRNPRVESQESFFIRHASDQIAAISTSDAQRFSRRKASLLQLLHPAHLGQKFQVLHAVRD